jgi:hypothetical protein
LELTECGPARNLPNGVWINVLRVLQFHGLHPEPVDVTMALAALIDKTPVEKGGRLLPDGSVDRG